MAEMRGDFALLEGDRSCRITLSAAVIVAIIDRQILQPPPRKHAEFERVSGCTLGSLQKCIC